MFFKTYINTLKITFRSTTFWLLFLILIITAVSGAIGGYYLGDDEPGVVLSYNDYIQVIANSLVTTLAFTALPLFSIVTTVLILNRDYSDDFFEIEKASNVNHLKYTTGRLIAIISIAAVATILSHTVCLHLYLYTRGGVPYLGTWNYIGDSIVRMLRIDFFVMLPSLVFYISLTYLVGTIFKKGIYAAITACSYLLIYYVSFTTLRFRMTGTLINTYFDFFSPLPWKLRMYFHVYDSEWFNSTNLLLDITTVDAIIGFVFLLLSFVIFSLISYLRIRKRTV